MVDVQVILRQIKLSRACSIFVDFLYSAFHAVLYGNVDAEVIFLCNLLIQYVLLWIMIHQRSYSVLLSVDQKTVLFKVALFGSPCRVQIHLRAGSHKFWTLSNVSVKSYKNCTFLIWEKIRTHGLQMLIKHTKRSICKRWCLAQ